MFSKFRKLFFFLSLNFILVKFAKFTIFSKSGKLLFTKLFLYSSFENIICFNSKTFVFLCEFYNVIQISQIVIFKFLKHIFNQVLKIFPLLTPTFFFQSAKITMVLLIFKNVWLRKFTFFL